MLSNVLLIALLFSEVTCKPLPLSCPTDSILIMIAEWILGRY